MNNIGLTIFDDFVPNIYVWRDTYIPGVDIVSGLFGDDTIGGNPDVTAFEGDIFNGDQGDDLLLGRSGSDTLSGGSGDDEIWGDQYLTGENSIYDGNDVLSGGSGNDTIDGSGGNDDISGGSGNDSITAGTEHNDPALKEVLPKQTVE